MLKKTMLHRIVHDVIESNQPKRLAAAMEISHCCLLQKANPDYEGKSVNIEELSAIVQLTGDYRALDYIASGINRTTITMPECDGNVDDALNHAINAVVQASTVLSTVRNAKQPCSDCGVEFSRCEREAILRATKDAIDTLLRVEMMVRNG